MPNDYLPLAKYYCAATKLNGDPCPWKARYDAYCFRHAMKLTGGASPNQTAK